MVAKRLSRTPEIEIDKCLEHFDSCYDLILTAARRTRQLQRHADPWGLMITPVDALLEAQNGTLVRDHYMRPKDGTSPEAYLSNRLKGSEKRVDWSN